MVRCGCDFSRQPFPVGRLSHGAGEEMGLGGDGPVPQGPSQRRTELLGGSQPLLRPRRVPFFSTPNLSHSPPVSRERPTVLLTDLYTHIHLRGEKMRETLETSPCARFTDIVSKQASSRVGFLPFSSEGIGSDGRHAGPSSLS